MAPRSALPFIVMLALGCGDSTRPCSVPADCASGLCRPDGVCAPVADVDATDATDATEVAPPDASDAADATEVAPPDASDALPSDASDPATTCIPGRDGRITRAEVPVAPDLRATWLVATDVPFASAGTPDAAPRWDLTGPFSGDTRALLETRAPHDFWFGDTFPTATYASTLEVGGDLFGLFEAREDGLYLLGVASATDGLTRTELAYDPPARLMAYPLEVGTTWTTTSAITGVTNGIPSFLTETWEGSVDARGEVATPFADFDSLRVVLNLDRVVGAALYFEVQHLFVTECFGTIASLRSQAYVTSPEFDVATELRRLAP